MYDLWRAAGSSAEESTAQGMASVHFTNVVSRPLVAPHGGIQARLGTNPLTVGLPRRGAPPILLDFATSAIAVLAIVFDPARFGALEHFEREAAGIH